MAKWILWLFGLSLPFWWAGAMTPFQLLPGLPVSALMFVCPMLAAAICLRVECGSAGLLLRRAFDWRRVSGVRWWALAVLLMPGVSLLACLWMRATGVELPPWQVPWWEPLALALVFLITALCEELGWSGYATERLQKRQGTIRVGLIVGAIWAVWHFVPLVQAQRSVAWIAWWTLGTVALRVLIVWIFEGAGGSVFAAAVCHASNNVSWMLFPDHGSHWSPKLHGLIAAGVAVVVAISATRKGPQAKVDGRLQ